MTTVPDVDTPAAVNALAANLIAACDYYNALRSHGVSEEGIGMRLAAELALLPDGERLNHIMEVAQLARTVLAMPGEPALDLPWPPIKKTIDRLLAEAPVLTDASGRVVPGQAPAIECMVMFSGGVPPVRGALSKTPEGNLRMLSPGMDGERQMMAELFFDYAAVAVIVITRVMAAENRIFVPRPGRVS